MIQSNLMIRNNFPHGKTWQTTEITEVRGTINPKQNYIEKLVLKQCLCCLNTMCSVNTKKNGCNLLNR